jgi:hypothetical protein
MSCARGSPLDCPPLVDPSQPTFFFFFFLRVVPKRRNPKDLTSKKKEEKQVLSLSLSLCLSY